MHDELYIPQDREAEQCLFDVQPQLEIALRLLKAGLMKYVYKKYLGLKSIAQPRLEVWANPNSEKHWITVRLIDDVWLMPAIAL